MIRTLNGFIVAEKAYNWTPGDQVHLGHTFRWINYKPTDKVVVCELDIDFQLPTGWSPIPEQVALLEEKLVQLDAAYVAGRTEIKRQIQDLLAITNEMEAA